MQSAPAIFKQEKIVVTVDEGWDGAYPNHSSTNCDECRIEAKRQPSAVIFVCAPQVQKLSKDLFKQQRRWEAPLGLLHIEPDPNHSRLRLRLHLLIFCHETPTVPKESSFAGSG